MTLDNLWILFKLDMRVHVVVWLSFHVEGLSPSTLTEPSPGPVLVPGASGYMGSPAGRYNERH